MSEDHGPLLALRGVRVVDVVSKEVFTTTVTIADGRIVDVGDRARCDEELDLTGCWAVPSFVDMHVHVTFDPREHEHPGRFSHDEPAETGVLRGVQNLTEAMRNGICAVRDAGGRQSTVAALKAAVDNGAMSLPELVTCGEPLCRPNGHGSVFGQVAETSEEIGRVVARHAGLGHEWLKIMNGPELWSPDKLRHIVAMARASGLRTAVHAFTAEGIEAAVRAGATTVEHGLVDAPDLIALARDQGTQFVPTAYCSWMSLRSRFTRSQSSTEVAHLDFWHRYLDQCSPAHIAAAVPVLPGTDAGCAPCTFDDYFDELVWFERWGVSPFDVLRAATLDAATCLGRADRIGSIDVGKDANLVITDGDPTESTSHLRHPLMVLFRGSTVVNSLGERWV